jgi:TrmH family RNA methyltransferase
VRRVVAVDEFMKRPTGEITSVQNPRVKQVTRLRDGRQRVRAGRFLIDGARELRRALAAGAAMETAFVCPEECVTAESRRVVEELERGNLEIWHCTRQVLEKMSYGQRSEGVLAVGITPDTSLTQFAPASEGCIGVLVGIEKPGNVGAVFRSADGAGVAGLIVADARSDLFNPNCIRASLGTIFTLPKATASSWEAIEWLRAHGYRMYAARVDAVCDYTQADLRGKAAVVLGSEAHGLEAMWHQEEIRPIRLPMRGVADSLNVSVTAGILFYEALRQRELGA